MHVSDDKHPEWGASQCNDAETPCHTEACANPNGCFIFEHARLNMCCRNKWFLKGYTTVV